ncbi:MAG: class I SAM-dependent methyltransferase family protein [Nanoarchaeota archaeon]|nr:class I SAM-dependent methyltransferase family protein [Nanoarchaeota archaeon]
MKLKQALAGGLTEQELDQLKPGHDVIGSIAILEIDRPLRKRRHAIAKAVMQLNNHIKTVLMKQGGHTGRCRTQKMGFILGRRTKETMHTENGARMMLDVEKVYFSPRLATERLRIAKQVMPGESVLVMFSGCAPYPLVLAKNTKVKEIVGVEINPAGHKYGLKNIALNKITNITLFKGDVKKIVPKLNKNFDRVIMPLPKGGEDFLDIGIKAVKKGGILHYYDFLHEDEIPKVAIDKIRKEVKKQKKKIKILKTVKCGSQQPHVYRTCTDCRII